MSELEERDRSPSTRSGRGPKIAVAALVLALALALVGGLGALAGTGWFAHRAWRFGEGELYVYNPGAEPVTVSVDGRPGVEIPAENAQRVELVGGTSRIEVIKADKGLERSVSVTIDGSDAVLKLDEETCLAIADVSGYYAGRSGADGISIVDVIGRDESLRVLESRNVVWPRKPMAELIDPSLGPPLWVEIVACELSQDRDFLPGYLSTILAQREAARQAERDQAR